MPSAPAAEIIAFEPRESVSLKDGRTAHFGPCPWDGATDATNIRKATGRLVRIAGVVYEILGVETYAKLPPPRLGEGIGIVVGAPEPTVE